MQNKNLKLIARALLSWKKNSQIEFISIGWTPKRPRQHYAVIDQKMVALKDTEHHSQEQQPGLYISSDKKRAQDLGGRFNEYTQHHGHELSF